jgi:chemotaxis protein methyltransferase CheR
MKTQNESTSTPLSPEQIKFFADYIEQKLGIIYAKDNYYQLERRLSDIATTLGVGSVFELWTKAQTGISGQFQSLLLDLSTNNETSFFRDPGLFKAIEEKILVEPRFSGDNPLPLRIWCCATSTGQEVYSMAILLHSWKLQNPRRSFSFLATDYSLRVLKQAEEGKYSQLEIQRGLPEAMINRFFKTEKHMSNPAAATGSWIVTEELKKGITFKQQNLLDDFGGIGPFEIVLCRNVLIYQNVENKRRIIAEIARRLVPGGYLVLGAAESLMGLSEDFEMRQIDRAVVYQRKQDLKTR